MKTCTVMCGLPAMGKSTMINEQLKTDPDIWIYSTDMFLDAVAEDQGLTYGEVFASYINEAQKFNERKLISAMDFGKNVIWDQTNLGKGKRRKIINRMSKAGYTVDCICFLPPKAEDYNEWNRRLDSRPGKVIPYKVLMSMKESFTLPSNEEGFADIKFYDMYGNKVNKGNVYV
jgi:predicted kinase